MVGQVVRVLGRAGAGKRPCLQSTPRMALERVARVPAAVPVPAHSQARRPRCCRARGQVEGGRRRSAPPGRRGGVCAVLCAPAACKVCALCRAALALAARRSLPAARCLRLAWPCRCCSRRPLPCRSSSRPRGPMGPAASVPSVPVEPLTFPRLPPKGPRRRRGGAAARSAVRPTLSLTIFEACPFHLFSKSPPPPPAPPTPQSLSSKHPRKWGSRRWVTRSGKWLRVG